MRSILLASYLFSVLSTIGLPILVDAQISAVQASPQGTITIAVQDRSATPIPSLIATYSRLPVLSSPNGTLAPGEVRYSGTVPLGAASSANVTVPAGTYLICVQTGTTSFLDLCKWGTATSVVVSASQTSPVAITLDKGVRLNVVIDDPGHLLPADRRPVGPPPVIVGVSFGQGAYLGADCTAAIGKMTCSMAVPIGMSMTLRLLNPTLGFTGEDGTTVDPGGIGPAFQASGSDLHFSFSVSGSKLKGVL